ncbi:MAG: class I SAM-dependent methyltransferase [Cyclobacteriaceae bacterium]|nr:class I SAM-dependent methyltransferase [Cyclobacteriaceae bacterium]
MKHKDYFSGHSKLYATFRPTYPAELYTFIFQHLKNRDIAWDCATGNGQVANYLSKHFKEVQATDISTQQLEVAAQVKNIKYTVCPAEKTPFSLHHFDLITVGQALHWFNLNEFYAEVNRVGKPGSLLAVWGYGLLSVNADIDELFLDFYNNIVGPYWDEARKVVENEYNDIPFPFTNIPSPKFFMEVEWTLEQFTGYLTTWSATQKYIQTNGHNPVTEFTEKLKPIWKTVHSRSVTFPVFLKLGVIG